MLKGLKMRWAVLTVGLLSFASSVVCGEPELQIYAKPAVYEVDQAKGIYCEGKDLTAPIQWVSPKGEVIKPKGKRNDNNRVHVLYKTESNGKEVLGLILNTTKLEDNGNWTCRSGDINKTRAIIVGQKTVVENKEVVVNGEEGRNVRLVCEWNGSPKPTETWYNKDGEPIVGDDEKYALSSKKNAFLLDIRDLKPDDTGMYKCKLTQSTLSHYEHKDIQLNVMHKPYRYMFIGEATEIIEEQQEEVFAVMNTEKNLSCNVLANPPPRYEWFKRNIKTKRDEMIKDKDRIKTSEDGRSSVLALTVRDDNDLTTYKCKASNERGENIVLFDVSLGDKPATPHSIKPLDHNESFILFEVLCENCTYMEEDLVGITLSQNLPVIAYRFEFAFYQENYPKNWDDAISLDVNINGRNDTNIAAGPLMNVSQYYVRVCAVNQAGESDWLEYSELVTNAATRLASLTALLLALAAICF